MKSTFSESELTRFIKASADSSLRMFAAEKVSRYFRSMHYLSSKLICDSIVLNLYFNRDITPNSADDIIRGIRRNTRSFYTTVESAFFPIENKFDEYAKTVLGAEYDKVRAMNMRAANYIVYVISLDISRTKTIDRNEIYLRAYSYKELYPENDDSDI